MSQIHLSDLCTSVTQTIRTRHILQCLNPPLPPPCPSTNGALLLYTGAIQPWPNICETTCKASQDCSVHTTLSTARTWHHALRTALGKQCICLNNMYSYNALCISAKQNLPLVKTFACFILIPIVKTKTTSDCRVMESLKAGTKMSKILYKKSHEQWVTVMAITFPCIMSLVFIDVSCANGKASAMQCHALMIVASASKALKDLRYCLQSAVAMALCGNTSWNDDQPPTGKARRANSVIGSDNGEDITGQLTQNGAHEQAAISQRASEKPLAKRRRGRPP